MKKHLSRRAIILSILSSSLLPNFLLTSQARSNENLLSNYKIGNSNAKIKVKEFFSLTCGHCKDFTPIWDEFSAKYKGPLKLKKNRNKRCWRINKKI